MIAEGSAVDPDAAHPSLLVYFLAGRTPLDLPAILATVQGVLPRFGAVEAQAA